LRIHNYAAISSSADTVESAYILNVYSSRLTKNFEGLNVAGVHECVEWDYSSSSYMDEACEEHLKLYF